jgi:serine/threonine protein kinase
MSTAGKYNLRTYNSKYISFVSVIQLPNLTFQQAYKTKLFFRIVKATNFIHSKNIIHGDIKLSNIMINTAGEVKLIDFGFSTLAIHKDQKIMKFHGTPLYMAPEILEQRPYNGLVN